MALRVVSDLKTPWSSRRPARFLPYPLRKARQHGRQEACGRSAAQHGASFSRNNFLAGLQRSCVYCWVFKLSGFILQCVLHC